MGNSRLFREEFLRLFSPKPPLPYTKNKEIKTCRVSFSTTCPRTINLGTRFFYGGEGCNTPGVNVTKT
jgi:hypothetical protein